MKMYQSLFLLTYKVAAQALATSEVTKDLAMHWNIKNNCGRRPSGPMYPKPVKSSGSFLDNYECDIMDDALYISGYTCDSTCQMDDSISVGLVCNCHLEMGPIHFIKDCEWEYKSTTCPTLTDDAVKYDWECNPLTDTCQSGQYESGAESSGPEVSDNTLSSSTTDLLRELPRMPNTVSDMLATYVHPGMPPSHEITKIETTEAMLETTVMSTTTQWQTTEESTFSPETMDLSVYTVYDTPTTEQVTTAKRHSKKRHPKKHHNSEKPEFIWNDDLLHWAMEPGKTEMPEQKQAEEKQSKPEVEHEVAPGVTIQEAPAALSTGVLMNDFPLLDPQPDYTDETDYKDEIDYKDDFDYNGAVYDVSNDYNSFNPRGRAINNIVNFFNDGSPPSVLSNQPYRGQATSNSRAYPISGQMENDFAGPSVERQSAERQQPYYISDREQTNKLQKRLGKYKAEITMLEEKLAEADKKHVALKAFVASSLKIEINADLLEIIK